ncbi:MAG: hypothetical protein CFE45_15965 [Burkholderiales bacterium PBB5]|nr:MAG: hypothetical protein CFE45_15965 [Burkholderiales bacterium PBB5]
MFNALRVSSVALALAGAAVVAQAGAVHEVKLTFNGPETAKLTAGGPHKLGTEYAGLTFSGTAFLFNATQIGIAPPDTVVGSETESGLLVATRGLFEIVFGSDVSIDTIALSVGSAAGASAEVFDRAGNLLPKFSVLPSSTSGWSNQSPVSFGADIGRISFTTSGTLALDNLFFTDSRTSGTVPEPTSFALAALALLSSAAALRRRKQD